MIGGFLDYRDLLDRVELEENVQFKRTGEAIRFNRELTETESSSSRLIDFEDLMMFEFVEDGLNLVVISLIFSNL